MNPELVMIGMVLERRCLDELLVSGLRPAHLGLPATQQAFQFLIDHKRDHGSLPTLTAFVRACPGLTPEPAPPDVSPSAVAAELIGLSLQRQTAVQLETLKMKPHTTMQDVQTTIDNLRSLAAEHQTQQLVTAESLLPMVDTWYEDGRLKKMTGLPYPWEVLNVETRGIQSTDFVVIYGRPKSGKTFELLHILNTLNLSRPGRILFVSFEMNRQQLINRLACIRARLSYGRFNRGELGELEVQTLNGAKDDIKRSARLGHEIIFTGPAITPGRRKKGYSLLDIEQAATDTKAIAIFVDGLLHCADIRTGKRSREWTVVSNLSSDTKAMANALATPVLATHQANREGEKDVPIDSQRDMAYADALAQDADMSLRVTKIRSDRSDGRQLLLQPTGAREFELLGFTVGASFCAGMGESLTQKNEKGQPTSRVDDYKKLKNLLRKEVEDDPLASIQKPIMSLGGAARAGHQALKSA